MPRRDDIKKANVLLDRELTESLAIAIGTRKFSDEARLAVRELVDLYNHSPERFVKKVDSMSSVLSKARTNGFTKRFAVEFSKETILKLQESLEHLNRRDIKLSQQEYIYVALANRAYS